jgi:putative FmdB family regulatory protein
VPTYEYACTSCGHRLEAVQSFSDDALTECPECGGPLRKVYGAVGIVLKGSGFYKTDSRAAASSNGHSSSDGKSTSGESSSGSDSSSGGDSKGGDSKESKGGGGTDAKSKDSKSGDSKATASASSSSSRSD